MIGSLGNAGGGPRFHDRADAGRALAEALRPAVGQGGAVVLGLPRGGVAVAAEVARVLALPLAAIAVRKVRSPHQPELALGAVTAGGPPLVNDQVVRAQELSEAELDRMVAAAMDQARADERTYLAGRPAPDLRSATVVLVDDGVATGATIRACIRAVREAGATRVVVGVPVAPRDTLAVLHSEADEVVCLRTPLLFRAVGWAYDDFTPVSTAEALALLG